MKDIFAVHRPIAQAIAARLHPHAEVVIHDLRSGHIVDIWNAFSHRKPGDESLLGDAFAGYRFRVPRTKINATMQLNVKNLTNSYLANPGRYNDNYTALRRVYLNEPRSYRLTTTLEF